MKADDIKQLIFAAGIIIIGAVAAYVQKWEVVTACIGVAAAALMPSSANKTETPALPDK